MTKRTHFFNSVRSGQQVGDGTVGALVSWLKTYIDALFQDSGIEYWIERDMTDVPMLGRSAVVPLADAKTESRLLEWACYVRSGNESPILEIAAILSDGIYRSLTWAKTFAPEDQCWKMAQAIQSALESISFSHEIPVISDLWTALPRKSSWSRESSLSEPVAVVVTLASLVVTTASGKVLAHNDWSDMLGSARFAVDAYLKDWTTVLNTAKVPFTVVRSDYTTKGGYLLTSRAEGITGIYVLKPGGNVNDDRDYLGYFQDTHAAFAAIATHSREVLTA